MSEIKPNLVLIGGGGHCVSVIDIIENGNKFNIIPNSNTRIVTKCIFLNATTITLLPCSMTLMN